MTAEQTKHARLEEAADWWARMQDEETAQNDVSAWLDWLEADPANRDAFDRIQELSLRLEATGKVQRRASVPKLALAASVAAMAIGAVVWFAVSGEFQRPTLSIATAVAASRQAPLPDGSTVSLGGATSVEARYTDSARALRLSEGEAYFEVKPDRGTQRPFVVDAGAVSIRALGTAFNVRKTRERVSVTVTEGRVQVGRSGESGGVEVAAGEQAVYDPAANRFRVTSVDASRSLGWREKRLEFVDEPMDSVIENVNRYSPRKIQIRGVDLHQHSYTGTFQPNTLDDWLVAIERAFPVRVETRGDAVVLEPRE